MNIKQETTGMTATFTGDLSVRSAREVFNFFRKIEKLEAHIIIDKPSAIDLCFFQLMYAYRKTCEASGKKIQIQVNLNEGDQEYISRTGLSSLFTNN